MEGPFAKTSDGVSSRRTSRGRTVSTSPCKPSISPTASMSAESGRRRQRRREAQLPGKPDPTLYVEAAHRLGVPPAECLVAEDAVAGVQAARGRLRSRGRSRPDRRPSPSCSRWAARQVNGHRLQQIRPLSRTQSPAGRNADGWPRQSLSEWPRRWTRGALSDRLRSGSRARVGVAGYFPHRKASSSHQSAASRTERPSSSVIVCSACPARLSASRTAPSRSRVRSEQRSPDPRAGVPGRPVVCAVPPGHPVLSAAPTV